MTQKQWQDFIPVIGFLAGMLLFWAASRFFRWQSRRKYGPQGRPTKKGDTRLF